MLFRPGRVAASITGPLLLSLALLGGVGCNKAEKAREAAAAAEAMLKAGDLPGASAAYDAALAEYPKSVEVATGAAYMSLLAGDGAKADQILAAVEPDAGEQLPQIKLRRALVAAHGGDLEKAKEHGLASGLPAGKLLAAEVNLADGERDTASGLLKDVQSAPGELGQLAGQYLELMGDENPMVAGLSEAQALWILGERKVAVQSAEELVMNLPNDRKDRDEMLMIWASRAASIGETAVARSLLEATIFPPEGQAWRKVATTAIAACADGDGATCTSLFTSLEGAAPEDGLADARATAAFLIAPKDKDVAAQLAGPYVSNAAARALFEAGDVSAATAAAPGGILASWLKAGG